MLQFSIFIFLLLLSSVVYYILRKGYLYIELYKSRKRRKELRKQVENHKNNVINLRKEVDEFQKKVDKYNHMRDSDNT